MLAAMFSGVNRVLASYPKIYLACHTRHVRDDETGRKLSVQLAGILDHLSAPEPLTISELARHLDVTESTVSLQIDKLQRFGYVRRMRDQNDGRRVRVRLTRTGHKLRDHNSVLDPDLVHKMIALLRPEEAETALKGLDLLAEAAARLMQRRELRGRSRR